MTGEQAQTNTSTATRYYTDPRVTHDVGRWYDTTDGYSGTDAAPAARTNLAHNVILDTKWTNFEFGEKRLGNG